MIIIIDLKCGDCLEVMQTIPEGSVDLILTDPPYGMDYQSARREDKEKRFPKIRNDKQPYIWFLKDAYRVLKNDGCIAVFCRWDTEYAFKQAMEWGGSKLKIVSFGIESATAWEI